MNKKCGMAGRQGENGNPNLLVKHATREASKNDVCNVGGNGS